MITDLGHPAFAAHDVDETIGFYGMLGIEPGQERFPVTIDEHPSGTSKSMALMPETFSTACGPDRRRAGSRPRRRSY